MTHYSVVLKDNSGAWLKRTERSLEKGLDKITKAILSRAQVRVPLKDGNLKASGEVSGRGLSRTVSFGKGMKYGAYQERGERFDGTHKVRRYTTAGTGKRYLKESGDSVLKEGLKKYL